MYNVGGHTRDFDFTKYGIGVSDSLDADERAGLAEVELENAEAEGDMEVWASLLDELASKDEWPGWLN